jgi:hypothetical protein
LGTTIAVLPHFTLSKEQVKTSREKWGYFLNHGHPGNQHDLEDVIGDDDIFKHAYEELSMDHWSKEEIDMYEQDMQKRAQQDAEGYIIPKEVSNAKPELLGPMESDISPEGSSDSERSPSIEESLNSQDH